MGIVLVCGGRDFRDNLLVHNVLNLTGATQVVQGGATGADELARGWAELQGIPCVTVPANWREEGRAAGPRRNQVMIERYQISLVVAFPGGRGTADMVQRARKAHLEIIQVTPHRIDPVLSYLRIRRELRRLTGPPPATWTMAAIRRGLGLEVGP